MARLNASIASRSWYHANQLEGGGHGAVMVVTCAQHRRLGVVDHAEDVAQLVGHRVGHSHCVGIVSLKRTTSGK